MASPILFPSSRRQRSPPLQALLRPTDLTEPELIRALLYLANETIALSSAHKPMFQRKNWRALIRKVEVLVVLFGSLKEPELLHFSYTSLLCFRELYLILHRSKILLDYCSHSSKLWMLLQNQVISGYFHDLNQEISTLLDVLPMEELCLSEDVVEQMLLLQRQLRRAKLYVDKRDEVLRRQLYSILHQLESGQMPDSADLRSLFVERLEILNPGSCRAEIEFLEEQICNQEGDSELSTSVVYGFVALTRYCRFLLFGFDQDDEAEIGIHQKKKPENDSLAQEDTGDDEALSIPIPKDFCCPISLELMQDPVIISTGQTYDRTSITRWMDEGNCTCPKTGQMLLLSTLVPNRSLRNLIIQWCYTNGIPFDPSEGPESSSSSEPNVSASVFISKAAIEANRATASLLVNQLSTGSENAKAIAAREIRYMAKTGKENRVQIARAGAIPHLCKLLLSQNQVAQENSVTAILNLSIYDKNKIKIMDEEGSLESIIRVLKFGLSTEARENAAASLFSLSTIHEYKRKITEQEGALEALAGLLRNGTQRGRKDAVTALFNLATHPENCTRMVESGAVSALVGSLGLEGISEEAAGALAIIVRRLAGAKAVAKEEHAVAGLIWMMRCGTPRGKENAVAALLELCRSSESGAAERVLGTPALAGCLQTLLFTGTKRARRKAASLARVFQRRGNNVAPRMELHYGGLGVGYSLEGNSGVNREPSLAGDVSMSMSISVV